MHNVSDQWDKKSPIFDIFPKSVYNEKCTIQNVKNIHDT